MWHYFHKYIKYLNLQFTISLFFVNPYYQIFFRLIIFLMVPWALLNDLKSWTSLFYHFNYKLFKILEHHIFSWKFHSHLMSLLIKFITFYKWNGATKPVILLSYWINVLNIVRIFGMCLFFAKFKRISNISLLTWAFNYIPKKDIYFSY
jgi:hypothetical protein